MRTPIHVVAFIVTCLLIALSACSDGPTDTTDDPRVIIPLAVGNQWWGKIVYYDSTGTAVDTATLGYRISGDTLIDGQVWAMWELTLNDTVLGSAPVRNTKEGYWFGSALQIKYPASEGDTYQWVSGSPESPGDTVDVTVVETNLSVSVPAGSFTCYIYRDHVGDRVSCDKYLSPNLGYIKWETFKQTSHDSLFVFERYLLDSLSVL